MKLEFYPAADAAYFEISGAEVETSREIEPGMAADFDAAGHIVGIEVRIKPNCFPQFKGKHSVCLADLFAMPLARQAPPRKALHRMQIMA